MKPRKLKIMISSQCATTYPFDDPNANTLTKIRKQLKRDIEKECFLGETAIKVWINEDATQSAGKTWWDECIDQAHKCDLMLVINSGNAGNQLDGTGIGICHAEFDAALAISPKKIYVLTLTKDGNPKTRTSMDREFQSSLVKAKILEARDFSGEKELIERAKIEVSRMMRRMAIEGVSVVKESAPNTGEALNWSRMDYSERSKAMTDTANAYLEKRNGGHAENGGVRITVSGKPVLFRTWAVPAAFSISAARELVGQPFLSDHKFDKELKGNVGGPVHIITCQKSATEAQALGLLGFPDATIISGTFGIYVADKIQKIQLCFISNCRDAASTQHGLQRFFEWLERTGENEKLADRALSRSKILKVIAGELT